MDAKHFEVLMGRPPKDDDLERANCEKGGEVGHFFCGICPVHGVPRFACACLPSQLYPKP